MRFGVQETDYKYWHIKADEEKREDPYVNRRRSKRWSRATQAISFALSNGIFGSGNASRKLHFV